MSIESEKSFLSFKSYSEEGMFIVKVIEWIVDKLEPETEFEKIKREMEEERRRESNKTQTD
tara:strand:+ start:213 stop:395 length:183 start_codon:yes stop_codon:yes gene_type:complete